MGARGRRRGSRRRHGAAPTLGVALLLLTGACGPAVPQWRAVPDAGSGARAGAGRIVTLTALPAGVLVGRYDADAAVTSTLQLRRPDGTVQAVPLATGDTDYGRQAELMSVSERGGEMVALGGHRAGAHGNVRWTVWRGDLTRLQEQPQTFEKFGGWNAGLLTGTAYGPRGPVIVGGWLDRDNRMGVTVWTPEGQRWIRAEPPAISAATATSLPSAGAVATAGDTYVVAGWETQLGADEVREAPVVWTAADPRGAWARTALPVPDGTAPARPTAVACAADRCAVAAVADRAVLRWRLHLSANSGPTVDGVTVTPTDVTADSGATAVVVAGDADVLAVGHDGATRTMTCHGDACSDVAERQGSLTALAADGAGGVLLAVTRDGGSDLWAATIEP